MKTVRRHIIIRTNNTRQIRHSITDVKEVNDPLKFQCPSSIYAISLTDEVSKPDGNGRMLMFVDKTNARVATLTRLLPELSVKTHITNNHDGNM